MLKSEQTQRRLRSASASLNRVFAVRMKKAWVLSYPLSAQRRLRSDWADAQADLSLRWVHSHFVGFVMSWLTYTMNCEMDTHGEANNFYESDISFMFLSTDPRCAEMVWHGAGTLTVGFMRSSPSKNVCFSLFIVSFKVDEKAMIWNRYNRILRTPYGNGTNNQDGIK